MKKLSHLLKKIFIVLQHINGIIERGIRTYVFALYEDYNYTYASIIICTKIEIDCKCNLNRRMRNLYQRLFGKTQGK
jgi:hypothetical protein